MLYEALTGHPPFAGTTTAQLIAAHLNTPPPQPSTAQPNLPAQIDPVIAKGMAKDPDNRYATTVELADAAHDAITTPLAPASEPALLGDAPPATPTRTPTLLDEQPPPAPGPTLLDDQVRPMQPPAPHAARQQAADLHHAATQQHPPGRPPAPQPRPADRTPREIGIPPPQRPAPVMSRNQWLVLGVAALVVVAALGGAGIYYFGTKKSNNTAATSAATTTPYPDRQYHYPNPDRHHHHHHHVRAGSRRGTGSGPICRTLEGPREDPRDPAKRFRPFGLRRCEGLSEL